MPKLSDTSIRAVKPREKPYKLFDTEGLFLIVHPKGGRWWRQRYRWGGKEQLLSLGTYPEITLAKAREKGAAVRAQVANGVNPSDQRQQEKVARAEATEHTFKVVALDWLEKTSAARGWTADHAGRCRRRLEVHLLPWLARKHIRDVSDDDLLRCLHRMQDRNLTDTARRALAELDEIFRFARLRRYIPHNPVADLRGSIVAPKIRHHAAIKDPAQLGALLRALDVYHGAFPVRQALRLQALVFARPGELQNAKWQEFDLEGAEWRIPSERMKMRELHIVPLARQAVAILRELHALTGPDGYVFPQARNASRPISNNTLNVALRACGYTKEQHTAHGFRSTASTLLNELGWNPDAIERQLAHGPRDKVRAAYNSAQHLPERRKMMQAWANHLDGLRSGAKVLRLRGKTA
jgi:integrase